MTKVVDQILNGVTLKKEVPYKPTVDIDAIIGDPSTPSMIPRTNEIDNILNTISLNNVNKENRKNVILNSSNPQDTLSQITKVENQVKDEDPEIQQAILGKEYDSYDRLTRDLVNTQPIGDNKSIWYKMYQNSDRALQRVAIDQMGYTASIGLRDPDEVLKIAKGFEDRVRADPVIKDGILDQILIGGVEMLGPMIEGTSEGLVAGGLAMLGGQIPPLALIPEEIATVPTAVMLGSGQYWYRQGAGAVYLDLLKSDVDRNIASSVGGIAGIPYAMIEFSQASKIFPGLRPLLLNAVTNSVRVAIKEALKRTGKNYAWELGEEVLQEINQIAFESIGKAIHNFIMTDKAKEHPTWGNIVKRIGQVTYESAFSLVGLMGGRGAVDVGTGIIDAKTEEKRQRTEDFGGFVEGQVQAKVKASENIQEQERTLEELMAPYYQQIANELKIETKQRLSEIQATDEDPVSDAEIIASMPKQEEDRIKVLKGLGFTEQDMIEQDLFGQRGIDIAEKGISRFQFMQGNENVKPISPRIVSEKKKLKENEEKVAELKKFAEENNVPIRHNFDYIDTLTPEDAVTELWEAIKEWRVQKKQAKKDEYLKKKAESDKAKGVESSNIEEPSRFSMLDWSEYSALHKKAIELGFDEDLEDTMDIQERMPILTKFIEEKKTQSGTDTPTEVAKPEPIDPTDTVDPSPGERWSTDPGTIPGEPTHFLDGDAENNKGYIVEKQLDDGSIYYIGFDKDDNRLIIPDTDLDHTDDIQIMAKVVESATETVTKTPLLTQEEEDALQKDLINEKEKSPKYKIGEEVTGVANVTKNNPSGKAVIESYNSKTGEYTFTSEFSRVEKGLKLTEDKFTTLKEDRQLGIDRWNNFKELPENERKQARLDAIQLKKDILNGKYDVLFNPEWLDRWSAEGDKLGFADKVNDVYINEIFKHFEEMWNLDLRKGTDRAKAKTYADAMLSMWEKGEVENFDGKYKSDTDNEIDESFSWAYDEKNTDDEGKEEFFKAVGEIADEVEEEESKKIPTEEELDEADADDPFMAEIMGRGSETDPEEEPDFDPEKERLEGIKREFNAKAREMRLRSLDEDEIIRVFKDTVGGSIYWQGRLDELQKEGYIKSIDDVYEGYEYLKPIEPENEIQEIIQSYDSKITKKTKLKKIAKERGLDKNLIKLNISLLTIKQIEQEVEFEAIKIARKIIKNFKEKGKSDNVILDELVKLYDRMPRLSSRTSTSVLTQAYSTPIPLAYIVGMLGLKSRGNTNLTAFDPTAGIGALFVYMDQLDKAYANEIDGPRMRLLQDIIPRNVWMRDVLNVDEIVDPLFKVGDGALEGFDTVLMNPPFGKLGDPTLDQYGGTIIDEDGKVKHPPSTITVDGYNINKKEHIISIKGLNEMKDDGKAVIIIGAKQQSGLNAFISLKDSPYYNYLNRHYKIGTIFEVAGTLYGGMGTQTPVRIITIDGRRDKPLPKSEKYDKSQEIKRFDNWDDVYNHAILTIGEQDVSETEREDISTAVGGRGDVGTGTQRGEDTDEGSVQGVSDDLVGTTEEESEEGDDTGDTREGERGSGVLPTSGTEIGGLDRGIPGGTRDGRDDQQSSDRGETESKGQDKPKGSEKTSKPVGSGGVVDKSGDVKPKASEYSEPYEGESKGTEFGTLTPRFMVDSTKASLSQIVKDKGMSIDQYVLSALKYKSMEELYEVLSSEQIDGVAMAIYQYERGGALIIGDQTGIGKGRQAGAMIRFAKLNGMVPIFITANPKLYSDIWGDLEDIKTEVKPLTIASGVKGDIKDKNEKVVYKTIPVKTQKSAITDAWSENQYDSVFLTYSQVSKKSDDIRNFLTNLTKSNDTFLILDESHKASGESKTGVFFRGGTIQMKSKVGVRKIEYPGILNVSNGAVFLSATFSKRPNTLPLYQNTDLGGAVDDITKLVDVINSGGVPLMQIITNALSKSGQYVRRERSFEGISFETRTMDIGKNEQIRKADSVAHILREVILFDSMFQGYVKKELQDVIARSTGNYETQLSSTAFASKVHNDVSNLLLAIKVESAINEAIETYKAGKKPILTLENTIGSAIERIAKDNNLKDGEQINVNYGEFLVQTLKNVRNIKQKDAMGNSIDLYITDDQMGHLLPDYKDLESQIRKLDVDLPISPIDYIKFRLEQEGIKTGEITGRQHTIKYSENDQGEIKGTYKLRSMKEVSDKNTPVNKFNSGGYDALILNASGSEGISLHASEKFTDQKQRSMIVVQPHKDIAVQIQMFGRIFRTGQVEIPEYINLRTILEMERRPAWVLAQKMESLNANTTADKDSAMSLKGLGDLFNKYGDEVAHEILMEDRDLQLFTNIKVDSKSETTGLMKKLTGRMAILPNEQQIEIYKDIEQRFKEYIDFLNATGQNDLITIDYGEWDAKKVGEELLKSGTDESSIFTSSTIIETVNVKNTRVPYTFSEMKKIIMSGDIDNDSKALKYLEDLVKSVTQDSEAYIKTIASDKVQQSSEMVLRSTNRALNMYGKVGKIYLITIGEEKFHGVVKSVKRTKPKKGNPGSASNFRIEYLLNNEMRTMRVPLSKIISGAVSVNQMWGHNHVATVGEGHDLAGTWDLKITEDNRENRLVITGNLTRGLEYANKGQIISYTTSEGEIKSGILLPRDWTPADLDNDPRKVFVFAEAVSNYLINAKTHWGGTIKAEGMGVIIEKSRFRSNEWTIKVPKATSKGGKYFLDTGLTNIVGDFESLGKYMVAKVYNEDGLRKAIKHLYKKHEVELSSQDAEQSTVQKYNTEANPQAGYISFGFLIDSGEFLFKDLPLKLKTEARKLGFTKDNFSAKWHKTMQNIEKASKKILDFIKKVLMAVQKWWGRNKDRIQIGAVGGDVEKVVRNKRLARAHILQNEIGLTDLEYKKLKMDLLGVDSLADADNDQIIDYINELISIKRNQEFVNQAEEVVKGTKLKKQQKNYKPNKKPRKKKSLKQIQAERKNDPSLADLKVKSRNKKLKLAINTVRSYYSSMDREFKRFGEPGKRFIKLFDESIMYKLSKVNPAEADLERLYKQIPKDEKAILRHIIEEYDNIKDEVSEDTQVFVEWFRSVDNDIFNEGKKYINEDAQSIPNHFPLVLKDIVKDIDLDSDLGDQLITHAMTVLNARQMAYPENDRIEYTYEETKEYLENFLGHYGDRGLHDHFFNQVFQTGEFIHNYPIELHRDRILPEWAYEDDVSSILHSYISSSYQSISYAKYLDKPTDDYSYEEVDKLVAEIKANGGDHELARNMIAVTLRLRIPESYEKSFVKIAKNITSFLLSLKTAIKNFGDLNKGIGQTNEKSFLIALSKALFSPKSRRLAQEMIGSKAVFTQTLQEAGISGKFANMWTRVIGFKFSESWIRKLTGLSSVQYAEHMLKKFPKIRISSHKKLIRRRFADWGVDLGQAVKRGYLTKEEKRRIGLWAIANTQPTKATDKPYLWERSAGVQTATIFRSFGHKSLRYVKDFVLTELAKGNVLPLVRWVGWGVAMQIPVNIITNLLFPKDDEDEDMTIKKILEEFLTSGHFGLLTDMMFTVKYAGWWSPVIGLMFGPFASMVSTIAFETVNTVSKLVEGKEDPLRPIRKEASRLTARRVPLVGEQLHDAITGDPPKRKKKTIKERKLEILERKKKVKKLLQATK